MNYIRQRLIIARRGNAVTYMGWCEKAAPVSFWRRIWQTLRRQPLIYDDLILELEKARSNDRDMSMRTERLIDRAVDVIRHLRTQCDDKDTQIGYLTLELATSTSDPTSGPSPDQGASIDIGDDEIPW